MKKLGLFSLVACNRAEQKPATLFEEVVNKTETGYAFAGMDGLRSLHTPRADVRLTGTFAASPLPCGCIQYTKI